MNKLFITTFILIISLNAQDLKSTINGILETNPILLESLKNYNVTKEEINIAKSGFYPKLDLTLGVGFEKTVKTNSPVQTDSSANFNTYQSLLKYTHSLFKGFQTTYQVKEQENRTLSSAYSYIEKVNDTSFNLVNSYIEIMRNIELLETKSESVVIDEDILKKVEKLYEAGLTNLSEVNKIESSLALAKSNKVVQENTLLNTTYNMQNFLGYYPDISTMSSPDLNITLPTSLNEAIQYAIQNNPSILVSNYNIKLAQASHKIEKSNLYPHIDMEISQAINNNLNGVENTNNSFSAMIFLKYNLFNGFSDSSNIQKKISKIHAEIAMRNQLKDKVIEELSLSWTAYEKLSEQLVHLEKYQKFSLKTLTLYSKEYDLGRRSLLDLLSAQNDFIGSKSQIIDAKYDILFAKYRILDALGTLVSTIIGSDTPIYSKVGLHTSNNNIKDSLNIYLDQDNDLITDNNDLCTNSPSHELKNIYGCKLDDQDIVQIERYTAFEFSKDEDNISKETLFRVKSLIHQLSDYGLENIKFEILANASYENLSQDRLIELSQKRADIITKIFIDAGIESSNITTYINSNKSKLFLNDNTKNNRVDIIVKKMKTKK